MWTPLAITYRSPCLKQQVIVLCLIKRHRGSRGTSPFSLPSARTGSTSPPKPQTPEDQPPRLLSSGCSDSPKIAPHSFHRYWGCRFWTVVGTYRLDLKPTRVVTLVVIKIFSFNILFIRELIWAPSSGASTERYEDSEGSGVTNLVSEGEIDEEWEENSDPCPEWPSEGKPSPRAKTYELWRWRANRFCGSTRVEVFKSEWERGVKTWLLSGWRDESKSLSDRQTEEWEFELERSAPESRASSAPTRE